MARKEVTAIFTRERHRFENSNGDVVIGSVEAVGSNFDDFSVKGQADPGELQEGQTYRFYGRWSSYKNRYSGKTEKQFCFDSFVKEQPHGRDGVIAYLLSAGEGLGLGRVRAHKCWELFGSDAVRTLRETPSIVVEKLAAAGLKLPKENAEEIARQLREDAALEACTLDLLDVLNGRGFPKSTGRLAVRQWGNRAASIIRRNPYKLMNFRGCGFKRCDALYLDLQHDRNAIRRQGLCAWYTVASNAEGHTWFPLGMVDRGIRDSIAGANLKLEDALKFARRLGALSETQTNGLKGGILPGGSCRWLAEGKKAQNENDLAEAVANAMDESFSRAIEIREIPSFPGYFAKSDGTIWSSWSKSGNRQDELKELSPETIKGGYKRVRLRVDVQQYVHAQVSHVILEAFVGSRPIDAVACHYDGNNANNFLTNLRWDTRKENEEDKKRHGTHQTGSGNPAAILSEQDAIEIRRLYDVGDVSTYKLAHKYGVDRTTICDLLKRKTWRHV